MALVGPNLTIGENVLRGGEVAAASCESFLDILRMRRRTLDGCRDVESEGVVGQVNQTHATSTTVA